MTTLDEPQPTHGFTSLGQAVHKRTVDHLPARTAYKRFNKRLALRPGWGSSGAAHENFRRPWYVLRDSVAGGGCA